MDSPREMMLTDKMRKMRDLSKELYEDLSHERMSYELIRSDLATYEQRKLVAFRELETIKKQIEESKGQSTKIIESANLEKNKIIAEIRTYLIAAIQILDKSKEFAKGIDAKVANDLRKEVHDALTDLKKVAA